MSKDLCDIGLVGLAVMGQNLVLNMNDHGYKVAVFNRTVSKVDDFIQNEAKGTQVVGAHSVEELVGLLAKPRRVMLMVKAGDTVDQMIDQLLPHLAFGQTIVLRSTVSPGVTEYVARYLAKHGNPLGVAFAPERVVQGFAIQEMQDLAQIMSGTTPGAEEVAARLFGTIAHKIVRMRPKEAEFAKLITNAYRYIQFAAANQFYMLVEDAGLDYRRVLTGMKQDYPRLRDFPGPGFAAGPCLMKDTMQLAAFGSGFGFGSMAMRINEGMPGFIVEQVARRHDLVHSTVGILGMAFKAESDDIRDALSYKLGKILRFRGASVLYSDEYAKDPTFISKEELVERSDIVIVGVPHAAYRTICVPDRVDVVDLWGALPRKAS